MGGGGVEIRCHRQSSHKLQNSQVAISSRAHWSTVSHEKVQSRSPLAFRLVVGSVGGGGGREGEGGEKVAIEGNWLPT